MLHGTWPDRWYPCKTGLARGDSYSFWGTLYIGSPRGPSLHGQRITIIPRVDSCSGDEFMPDYCRVQESNERNNENSRAITLPYMARRLYPQSVNYDRRANRAFLAVKDLKFLVNKFMEKSSDEVELECISENKNREQLINWPLE